MNPFNHKITRATRHTALMLLASFLLVSCGGGGGTSIPPGTTVISGIVSDDAIAGATVTVTSVNSGLVLGNATTAANGSFSLNALTTQIGAGYTLNSSGGTMNGLNFNGNLSAIYPVTADTLQANLTLLTSALAEAAQNTTQFSGTTLQKHEAIKENAIARGVINPDYFLVEPNGPSGIRLAAMRNLAQQSGASATTGALAQIVNGLPTPGGCGVSDDFCTIDVSSLGESLDVSFQGAKVSALAGVLRSCRVVAKFVDASKQAMTMSVEYIVSPVIPPCQITGNVTLTLPPSAAPAPDACLPLSGVASVPNCVTTYSGMTPSYFVDGGDGHNHRSDKNTHSSTPVLGHTVTFKRSYGAVLSASSPRSINTQNQWAGKTAVIFVHGFSHGGFGGDDDTWGILPQLLLEDDPSYVALNFQWITDASYLTVADELAKAVDYAYLSTGKKVHIVAHSFGGVLSRVMLQNLNGTTSIAAAKVATLTTVGTPHSGIVKGGVLTVEGQTLPVGWGSLVFNSWCGQISCYESGLNANIAGWALRNLACPPDIPDCQSPVSSRGYINARLADTANHPFPPDLQVRVLIGQIIDATGSPLLPAMFSTDDGLISYYGQRFIPQSGRNALLADTLIGGATVTERILGLLPGVNAFPGDPVGSIVTLPYARNNTFNPLCGVTYKVGYKHSTALSTAATGWTDGCVENSEVNVPASCGTAATCQHDTWLNIKEFLQANIAPSPPPVVTLTATPSSIASGETSTLSWSSTNSTSCSSPSGGGTGTTGSFTTPPLTTTTTYTVTCTGAGGTASQSATVTVAGTPASVGNLVDNFDGTAMQSAYWTPTGTAAAYGVNPPGAVSVLGGILSFGCHGRANTSGKYTFSGNQIVIESRFSGTVSPRDTFIALVDSSNEGDIIVVGDTSYGGYGLYAAASGSFNLFQVGNGNSVSVYKEYRLTLAGTSLTWERGDTLSNITETTTKTLGSSIAGKNFYLVIGTGGPDYCPGSFDWIRVISNPPQQYAYTANYNSNDVSQYTIGADGALIPMAISTVAAGSNPHYVTLDPAGKHVYVANAGGNVSQYTVGTGGELTPMAIPTVAAGTNPSSIIVSPSGQYAYVANYDSNNVSQYTIGADGALTPMATPIVAAGSNPHRVAIDPTGKYVYVANSTGGGIGTTSQYTIGTDGALTPMVTPMVTSGTSPQSIVIDTTGRYVYVANAGGNVSQYTIGTDGALTPMSIPTVTTDSTYSVTTDPSGKYAYVANYNSGTISQYTIGAGGALTLTTTVATGTTPSSITIESSGMYAYVTSWSSNNISQYTIGTDGALTPMVTLTVATGTNPEFITTGK